MRISDWSSDVCSSDLKYKRSPKEPRLQQYRIEFDQAAKADLAWATTAAKPALSCTAMSASTLRSSSIEAFFVPAINTLYDTPNSRQAALIRVIQRARKVRFLLRRSR